tara:strand:+ start:159 stop:1880 length:1722 start_codon:yes stop_codon:yes gene_type:complete
MPSNSQLVGKFLLDRKKKLFNKKINNLSQKNSNIKHNGFTEIVKNKQNYLSVEKQSFEYFRNSKFDFGNYVLAAEEFASLNAQGSIKRIKYVLRKDPNFEAAHSLFLKMLLKLSLWKGIGKVARNAVKHHPKNEFFLNIFARHLLSVGEKHKALNYYEKCIELNPKSYNSWLALGNCYYVCRNLNKAVYCLELSKKISHFMTDSAFLLESNILQAHLRYDDAMEKLKAGIKMFPLSKPLTTSLAMTNLKIGNKEEGFELYNLIDNSKRTNFMNLVNYKLKSKNKNPQHEITKINLIEDIEELNKNALFSKENFNILVLFEQGFGDYLHFYRYLEPLLSLGHKITALGANKSVFSLLKYANNSQLIRFSSKLENEDVEKFEYKTFTMNIPFLLGNYKNTPPPPKFNLEKLKNDKKELNKKIKGILDPKKKNIGISWKGNKEHIADISRSIDIKIFSKIFKNQNCQFFAVDKNLTKRDKNYLKKFKNLVICDELIADWADTAMIVLQLDELVTVDTSLGHIGGTLYKPTKILIAKDPDWRWGIKGNKTEWYESVELIRQSKKDCWQKELDSLNFG